MNILSKSTLAKDLGIRVNMADIACVQCQLESLVWQAFDALMAANGSHDWLKIIVSVSWIMFCLE